MEIVQKIEKQYVSSDCIQTMIPYENTITILNQDGIIFSNDTKYSKGYINKYLKDERRFNFPYSNIPIHYERLGFKKIAFTNQLLEFDKPYFKISDGYVEQRVAIKDNNEALLVKNIIEPNSYIDYMTYNELEEFISKKDSDEQVFYVNADGSLPNGDIVLPTKEKIYDYIKDTLLRNVNDFKEYQEDDPNSIVSRYLKQNPIFLNYIEESIKKNLDLSLIDFNIKIGSSPIVIIRVKDDIKIEVVEPTYLKDNLFQVEIYNLPVNKYTLEQLKYAPNIIITKDPKIPLRLNPGVTRIDIEKAKQMVKSKKSVISNQS